MADCLGCGEFVTDRYAAVFGDESDTVSACPGCSTIGERAEGATVAGAIDADERPRWLQ